LDFSAQMLDIARQRVSQTGPPMTERVDYCLARAQDAPKLFPLNHFDLVLCHTLLEYVPEPQKALSALVSVLRPGGLLSILFVNAHADPLRWAIARGDLDRARLALQEQVSQADLFGLPRQTFTAETVNETVTQMDMDVVAEYGVRIFADYMPPAKLDDPAFYARLLDLEAAAGMRHPYKSIARYNQILAKKTKHPSPGEKALTTERE
jgi:S-adenosylmethionine-dependent methyltransferase